jgi:hypothetical protein
MSFYYGFPPQGQYTHPYDLRGIPYSPVSHAAQFGVPDAIPSAPPSYHGDPGYSPPQQQSYYSQPFATPPAPTSFAPIARHLHRKFKESENGTASFGNIRPSYRDNDIVNSNFNHELWHNNYNTYNTHYHHYYAAQPQPQQPQQQQQHGVRGGWIFSLPWPFR